LLLVSAFCTSVTVMVEPLNTARL